MNTGELETIDYDVVIVGGGPAGLAAAIRLKQMSDEAGQDVSVCVVEKGSEIGAHIISGAVIDPRALDELLPGWKDVGCPLAETPVTHNEHWMLTRVNRFAIPHFALPPFMRNKGTFTGSLGDLCRWMAERAEGLGVEIFPGFAASSVLYDEDGSVRGVATGAMGIDRDGNAKPEYQPGIALRAKYTFFAEGARGHLTKTLKRRFALDAQSDPQIYGLGMKEVWDIDPSRHVPGRVIHTQGWPLTRGAYGGGFVYFQSNAQVALGFVVGLGYTNPHLDPYQEFQRWKSHPQIRRLLEGGRRASYGARAICEGGLQAIPELVFPGGALIGCSAGFVNVPRIKGTHTAMKSGMLAAEAAFGALQESRAHDRLEAYSSSVKASWIWSELKTVRNAQPLLSRFGDLLGTGLVGIELWLGQFGIKLPYTLRHHADHSRLQRKTEAPAIVYPKPDGVVSFDRMSSVFLSGTAHAEDQPVHLRLADPTVPVERNLALFNEPAQRYCPAGVYEIVGEEEGRPRLQINSQNCVHCKTCDIKDPAQNIDWVAPEGGGGPNYANM